VRRELANSYGDDRETGTGFLRSGSRPDASCYTKVSVFTTGICGEIRALTPAFFSYPGRSLIGGSFFDSLAEFLLSSLSRICSKSLKSTTRIGIYIQGSNSIRVRALNSSISSCSTSIRVCSASVSAAISAFLSSAFMTFTSDSS